MSVADGALRDEAVAQRAAVVVGGGEVGGDGRAVDADGAQQHRDRDAGAVLARCTVDEQRSRPVRRDRHQLRQPRRADVEQEQVELVRGELAPPATGPRVRGQRLDQRQSRDLRATGEERVRPGELRGVAQVDHGAGRPDEPTRRVGRRRQVVGHRCVGTPEHTGARHAAVDGRHPTDVPEVGQVTLPPGGHRVGRCEPVASGSVAAGSGTVEADAPDTDSPRSGPPSSRSPEPPTGRRGRSHGDGAVPVCPGGLVVPRRGSEGWFDVVIARYGWWPRWWWGQRFGGVGLGVPDGSVAGVGVAAG